MARVTHQRNCDGAMASSIFWNTLAEDFTELGLAGGLTLRWQFSGGQPGESGSYSYSLHRNDLDHHDALVVNFKLLAQRAGAALGDPGDSVTAWYAEIRTNHKDPRNSSELFREVLNDGNRIWRQFGKIPDVCRDSAARCMELAMYETTAERTSQSFERPPVRVATIRGTGGGQSRKSEPTFLGRASWLADRLRERSWNKNDCGRFGGPDRKTIQKILDGFPIREDVLEKLAKSLSKQYSKLGVLNIPQD